MKKLRFLALAFISALIFSCSERPNIYIVADGDEIVRLAGQDLEAYLSQTYPDKLFQLVEKPVKDKQNIIFEISNEDFSNDEAYLVSGAGQDLYIRGKTSRALINGAYGLLKHLGWNFFLSFEAPPAKPKKLDFSAIRAENFPLKEKRIIFNWHNFLSGCTGWNYDQWEQWIDNACKIGFNTVMVHAYGNNPMHSFSFNGQEKDLGFLSTTTKGRDWGTQHVNDVQLLYGGEIFEDYEFGSEAAKVADKDRSKAATTLMQKAFRRAAQKAMNVCFAIDVDTWMANPQNLINTVPREALIDISGYKTVNPEHPEGKKYYREQLGKLFSDYPEITILAAWMRKPIKQTAQGSIWLLHDSQTLPGQWKEEYFEILKNHPELRDERPLPGLFAISKIVQAFRQILDEIKPETELALGSWDFEYVKWADAFMPDYCGFMPLDYSYIFDNPEVIARLKKAGENRRIYPIVWAHHDDHRYIGRPYIPFSDFNALLNESNSSGYGIIHWTTHPLDLLFSNYENQVWKNTENETWKKAAEDFARALMKDWDEHFVQYYSEWFMHAPMFGRETTDYFMRLNSDYTLEGYRSSLEAVDKARKRLNILMKTNENALNERGLKEYQYQLRIEEFIISFFENHHNAHQAFKLLEKGSIDSAHQYVQQLNPVETIEIFSETIKEYGATQGEKGLLVSLNLRWLPDYIDLQQRTGLEPLRINFQSTSHDSLAQGAGHNTFFVDIEKNFYLSLGEKETGATASYTGKLPPVKIEDSWINIGKDFSIPIRTMRNQFLPPADYELQLLFAPESAACKIDIKEGEKTIGSFKSVAGSDIAKGNFTAKSGDLTLRFLPENGIVKLSGIVVRNVEQVSTKEAL